MDFGAESSGMTIIKAGLAAKLNYANVGALRGDHGKWIAADNEFAADQHVASTRPRVIAKDLLIIRKTSLP